MKTLKEVTPDWDIPNHVYFTNDSKDNIFGYVKASNNEITETIIAISVERIADS